MVKLRNRATSVTEDQSGQASQNSRRRSKSVTEEDHSGQLQTQLKPLQSVSVSAISSVTQVSAISAATQVSTMSAMTTNIGIERVMDKAFKGKNEDWPVFKSFMLNFVKTKKLGKYFDQDPKNKVDFTDKTHSEMSDQLMGALSMMIGETTAKVYIEDCTNIQEAWGELCAAYDKVSDDELRRMKKEFETT
jgi:hypothetical protein